MPVRVVAEGKITREQALVRVTPDEVETLLHPRFDPKAQVDVLAVGLPASPGAASGEVASDPDEAEHLRAAGKKVILIRPETTPDDIHGMIASEGVLTTRGGMTCHAAIVARGMGKPCIVGCESLRIDPSHTHATAEHRHEVVDAATGKKEMVVKVTEIRAGDLVSIDGATGRLLKGAVPLARLFLADPAAPVESLQTDRLVSAPVKEQQERVIAKFDKCFGMSNKKYGKVTADRTMADIEKRRADRWNFLFIAGMWFQDLFNYDFRRTEQCIIPYATQEGEISFCAYKTGIGWRNIDEKMHMTATLTKWYEEHGRHEIIAGGKSVNLTDKSHRLVLRDEDVNRKRQTDLDELGIAKTAREEKKRERDAKLQAAENERMMKLYRQHVLKEPEGPALVQIGGIAPAKPAASEEVGALGD